MEERQVGSRAIRLSARSSAGHYALDEHGREGNGQWDGKNETRDPSEGEVAGWVSVFRQAEFFPNLFDGNSFPVFGFFRALVEEFHESLVLARGGDFRVEIIIGADVESLGIASAGQKEARTIRRGSQRQFVSRVFGWENGGGGRR